MQISSVCSVRSISYLPPFSSHPRRLIWVDFSNRFLCALASLGFGQQGTPAGEQKQGMRAGNLFQTEGLSVSLNRRSVFSKVACYTWYLSFLVPNTSPYSWVSGLGYDSPGRCPLRFPPCLHLYNSINLIDNYSTLNAPSVFCWYSDAGSLISSQSIVSKSLLWKFYTYSLYENVPWWHYLLLISVH